MTLVLEWRAVPAIETAWVPQPATADVPAAVIGPPGRDGAQPYEHAQASAAVQWTVNHNLGRWPSAVTVMTTGGLEVEAGVTHVSTGQTVIDFSVPLAGRVRVI